MLKAERVRVLAMPDDPAWRVDRSAAPGRAAVGTAPPLPEAAHAQVVSSAGPASPPPVASARPLRRWRAAGEHLAARRAARERRAEAVAEAARRRGYREGYAEGLAAGRAAGVQQGAAGFARGIQALRDEAVRLQGFRDAVVAALQPELVELALAVGQQLAAGAIQEGAEVTRALLARLLRETLPASAVRVSVRLHPRELDALRDTARELQEAADRPLQVELVPDRRIEPGGCVIETEMGGIDARVATRWEQIREAARNGAEHANGRTEPSATGSTG